MTAGARDFKCALCLLLTLYVRKVKPRICDRRMKCSAVIANRLYKAFACQMRKERAHVMDGIDFYSVDDCRLAGIFRRNEKALHFCVTRGYAHRKRAGERKFSSKAGVRKVDTGELAGACHD